MPKRKSEKEIGDIVKEALTAEGYSIHTEVQADGFRVDIVAIRHRLITTLELKASLSLELLGQAVHRSHFAHFSIAACPFPKDAGNYLYEVLESVHRASGIGIWKVYGDKVREVYAPRTNAHAKRTYLEEYLRDEQIGNDAGTNKGYWSPYVDTKRRLIEYVTNNEGCGLRDAMLAIEHHYSSHGNAVLSMRKLIGTGKIVELCIKSNRVFLTGVSACES